MALLTKVPKLNDLESKNPLGLGLPIFEVFILIILFSVNLSLNQNPLVFLLCVRETSKTHEIPAIFL